MCDPSDAPARGQSASPARAAKRPKVELPERAAKRPAYLEKKHKVVTEGAGRVVAERLELRPCLCRSWFCGRCAAWKGYALRDRLVPVVERWSSAFMLTLTVDPTLFAGPREAWSYLKAKRCVARLVRELYRRGLIASKHYFAVYEFHKNGWPHLHVLVQAKRIPFAAIAEVWGRYRPTDADPYDPEGNRPRFGSVRFTAPKFANQRHAALYATKYLTKSPEQGYPGWLMDAETREHRYSVSKGFWAQPGGPDPQDTGDADDAADAVGVTRDPADDPGHDPAAFQCFCGTCRENRTAVLKASKAGVAIEHPPACFCRECRGDVTPEETSRRRRYNTQSERVADCTTSAVVVRRLEFVSADGLRIDTAFEYVADVTIGYARALTVLEIENETKGYVGPVTIYPGELGRLLAAAEPVRRGSLPDRPAAPATYQMALFAPADPDYGTRVWKPSKAAGTTASSSPGS